MVETIEERRSGSQGSTPGATARPQSLNALGTTQSERIAVPLAELSRVLGGSLVAGSLSLIGDDL